MRLGVLSILLTSYEVITWNKRASRGSWKEQGLSAPVEWRAQELLTQARWGHPLLLTDSFCPWSYQGTCHVSTAPQLIPPQSSVGYLKGGFEDHSVSWKKWQQVQRLSCEKQSLSAAELRGSSQSGTQLLITVAPIMRQEAQGAMGPSNVGRRDE